MSFFELFCQKHQLHGGFLMVDVDLNEKCILWGSCFNNIMIFLNSFCQNHNLGLTCLGLTGLGLTGLGLTGLGLTSLGVF